MTGPALMPLDPDALFAPLDLTGRQKVLVAISGGSDSTALLHLFKSFANRRAPALGIVAATVDHGLRPASANEARAVAQLGADLGIGHVTLRWQGEKPATGIQAAARLARYRLLDEAARQAGADIVLLGHTADDQAETVAMRHARGSGDGLRRGDAGMAPAMLYRDRTWFVRPLLGTSRAVLRDCLRDAGLGWIDDPSNRDRAYERVRIRESRPEAPADPASRLADSASAADLISSSITRPAPGLLRLDPAMLASDGCLTALRLLLAVCGGTEHLPDEARAQALLAMLDREKARATLSRAVVDKRHGSVWLHRESRGLPAPAALPEDAIWDGRFRAAAPTGNAELIAPVGNAAAHLATCVPPGASQALVMAALRAEPGIWRAGSFQRQTAPAQLCPVLAPWRLFLPSFDLAPAAALRRLFSLAGLPSSPWRDHIFRGP
ncbi:tRNA lysidine(34) synthetase TilS [Aliihoeflea sp. 40Bstr573]|uniref:tRNA lysidine(34) synthetase TilS n=1 Tax=Aliihoeflea sp. 40Bstr573 TaxID=2696467 RepID=UPI0020949334|nr:tRNA lysidine(34) synthetase TilS [Aliihoeflea sp. 40Bstr573]